ncbi:hypothetical protein KI387_000724, partial [Taxus chinensis]
LLEEEEKPLEAISNSWKRLTSGHKGSSTHSRENHNQTGISVGNSVANNIPEGTFDLKGDGNGGFIIDSGTTLTFLPHAAFTAVAQLLDCAVGLPRSSDSDFDLCYQLPSGSTDDVAVPDITYHFGGGADYVIRGQYSFATVRDSNSLCFLTLEMGESSDAVAIFGNFHQQNYHILYDNANHI